jgi:hypothetical protein
MPDQGRTAPARDVLGKPARSPFAAMVEQSDEQCHVRAPPGDRDISVSLPRHCDAQAILGGDQVVVVILADVNLHPGDVAVEGIAGRAVVG